MPVPTPTDRLDAFGALLRAGRKAHGFSQDQLADLLGIVQSQVSALERGAAVDINAALIVRLERILGIDAGVLTRAAARRDPRTAAAA